MNIDHKLFFDGYRAAFGPIPNSRLVKALDIQLDFVAKDDLTTDPREFAYMLGTEAIETGGTYEPVEEIGSKEYFRQMYSPDSPRPSRRQMARAHGHTKPIHAQMYHGNGYVQLTWLVNYRKASKMLLLNYGITVNLVAHPELARVPEFAYYIMSGGMHTGLFTNSKLKDYINSRITDYFHARRIINPGELKSAKGREVVQRVANFSKKFEKIIKGALV